MEDWREGRVDFERAHDGDDCVLIGEAEVDGKEPLYAVHGTAFATVNGGRTLHVRVGKETIAVRAAGARIRPHGASSQTISDGTRVAVAGRRTSEPGEGSYRRMQTRSALGPDARGELHVFLLDKRGEPIVEHHEPPHAEPPRPEPEPDRKMKPIVPRPDSAPRLPRWRIGPDGRIATNVEGVRERMAGYGGLGIVLIPIWLLFASHPASTTGIVVAIALGGITSLLQIAYYLSAEPTVTMFTDRIELRDRKIPMTDVERVKFVLMSRLSYDRMYIDLRQGSRLWFFIAKAEGEALAHTLNDHAESARALATVRHRAGQ
jgi:hypothetical protein